MEGPADVRVRGAHQHRHGAKARLRVLLALAVCVCLIGCAEPKCGGSDLKYYDQALAYQLGKRGIRADVRNDGTVCVDGKHAAEFDTAVREADKYFHEIADLLQDECEERAFAQWATHEKLRFDVRGATSGKRMFLLRSFNAEEVASNRQRLTRDAPKGMTCPARS